MIASQENHRGSPPATPIITEGIYWLGTHRRDTQLQCNTYLLVRGGIGILVDPGSTSNFDETYAAAARVINPTQIGSIVLTQPTADAVAAIRCWLETGLSPRVFSQWWTGAIVALSGVQCDVTHIHAKNVGATHPVEGVDFVLPPFLSHHGHLWMVDRPTGTVFTGDLFGSVGYTAAGLVGRIRSFSRRLLTPCAIAREVFQEIEAIRPAFICPQHGPAFDTTTLSIAALRSALMGGPEKPDDAEVDGAIETTAQMRTSAAVGEQPAASADSLADEIEKLRRQNLDLQQAVVLANDARIRDPSTGFYNETFLQEFLPTILVDDQPTIFVLWRVDEDPGDSATYPRRLEDAAMHAFATELVNAADDGVLNFRFRGLSCLTLIPRGDPARSRDLPVRVIRAVRESELFPRPTTVSAVHGTTDQLQTGPPSTEELHVPQIDGILSTLTGLLDHLDEGPPAAIVGLGDDVAPQDLLRQPYVLVATADPFLAESLSASLTMRGIPSRVVSDGTSTVAQITDPPAIVVVDANIPQLDAFQIRGRYQDTPAVRSVPFLLVAEFKSETIVRRSLDAGIEHVFSKPVDIHELSGVCRIVLNRTPV